MKHKFLGSTVPIQVENCQQKPIYSCHDPNKNEVRQYRLAVTDVTQNQLVSVVFGHTQYVRLSI